MNEKVRARAETLLEALPYIRQFFGRTIVIKFGGAAMNRPELSREFARDVTLLQYVGMRPVIIHGGGPQVSETMEGLGIHPTFVDGHRVTDREAMNVVEMVLAGKINKEIVSLINHEGGRAVGISGKDGLLAVAELHKIERRDNEGNMETVSLGRVGTVESGSIDPSVIRTLDDAGFIPVIAPVAVDREGESLNVNADTMAGAVAAALQAEKLILLTDTPGLLNGNESIPRITPREAEELIRGGVISGGMLPKVRCCLEALKSGIRRTHIIDGREPHALLLEIFTMRGVGTLISDDIEIHYPLNK